MENRIHWKTEELECLEAEDLEAVAGGITKVTPEQQESYTSLRNKVIAAREAYENGTGTLEELQAASDAMLSFVRKSCAR